MQAAALPDTEKFIFFKQEDIIRRHIPPAGHAAGGRPASTSAPIGIPGAGEVDRPAAPDQGARRRDTDQIIGQATATAAQTHFSGLHARNLREHMVTSGTFAQRSSQPPARRTLPTARPSFRGMPAPVARGDIFALDDDPNQLLSDTELRAISRSLTDWLQASESRYQNGINKRASKRIWAAAIQESQHLDLNGIGLDSLPGCLGQLRALRVLQLNDNRLAFVPSQLPPALQHLEVRNCGLRALPDELPDTLERLDVCDNALDSLPSILPGRLRFLHAENNLITGIPPVLPAGLLVLDMSHNRITDLPQAWPDTAQDIYLHQNPIRDIPLGVTLASPRSRFYFSMENLSPEAGNMLTANALLRREFAGEFPVLDYVDPLISQHAAPESFVAAVFIAAHDNEPGPDRIDRHRQRLAFWQQLAVPEQGDGADWPARSIPSQPVVLANFLGKLRVQTMNADIEERARLRHRINQILGPIEADPTLRAICFGLIQNAETSCADGQSTALDGIETAVLSHRVASGAVDVHELLFQGRQMQALEAVDAFAKSIRGPDFGEVLEIIHALRIRLADEFSLPIGSRMMVYDAFARQVGVTDEKVEQAREHVQAALDDPTRQSAFLAEWGPWTTHLQEQYPKEFALAAAEHDTAAGSLHARMSTLDDDRDGLDSADYLKQVATLEKEFSTLDSRIGLAMRLPLTAAELDRIRTA